jgi:tetratricopeptide (TPR) repeat protein
MFRSRGARRQRLLLVALLVAALTPATCLSADAAEAHFRRAGELAAAGKLDAAIREYRLGLKIAPRAYHAHNNLGVLYSQKQDYPQALASFREADRLRPGDQEISFGGPRRRSTRSTPTACSHPVISSSVNGNGPRRSSN